MAKSGTTGAKPKKHLILTSSGGGGHTAAAESIKAELIAKGIQQDQIEIVDLMGLYEKGANQGDPWIPTISIPGVGEVFSGKENTKTWNDLQAKGGEHAPQKLESLTDKQWMAEKIQNETVHKRLKKYLADNNVQGVYNTQALSAAPICQAVREYNDEQAFQKKDRVKITGVVTEFLTDYATHFTNSLRSIDPRDRQDLVMRSITPPLRDPGESREAYTKRHGLQGIEFQYASEKAAPSPVNPLYSEGRYSETGTLVIKASASTSTQGEKLVRDEQSFVKEQLKEVGDGLAEVHGKAGHFSVKIDKEKDVVNFLTLGSQGSEAMFDYIDKFLEQSIDNTHDGQVLLFITTSKNESTKDQQCMYHKALDHLNKRIKEYEERGTKIPQNAKVVPLAFQDQENMASLMQNASNLIVRTGGMTAMQSKESRKNDKRQVTVHCEVTVPSIESFPVDNPDARREMFQKGLVKWEKGNADKLILEANGSLGGPQTINFGFGGAAAQAPASLFKAAYDTYIEVEEGGRPVTRPLTPQERQGKITLHAESSEQIKKLIYEGSNPNLQFPAGSYLIDHCADFDTMKLLVEHGAKLTEQAKTKEFLKEGELEQLQEAEKQFKVDFKAGKSAIHKAFETAVKDGKEKEVKGLMYNFDSIKNHKIEIEGQLLTPVQIAIKNKQTLVLKTLLGKGAKIDTKTTIGGLLHYAIAEKNLDAVQVLLEKGVNPHTKYHGKSAYDLLETETDKQFAAKALKVFIKAKVLDPDGHSTSIAGMSSEVLKDIMFEGGNKYKNSDLHRAVYYLNKGQEAFNKEFPGKSFQDILDQNVDQINTKNERGQSAIALAKDQAVRRELVRYGADPAHAIGISTAEKNELKLIQKEYNDITDNTLSVLSQAFKTSKSKEEFTASIMGKFEKMYQMEGEKGQEKLEAHREAIRGKCEQTFGTLKAIKDEAEQQPIIKRFYQKLCSIVGRSNMDKAMKQESGTMRDNLKDIQSALRKHGAEAGRNARAPAVAVQKTQQQQLLQ